MRVAHLFAGAGGGLLADLIIGHTPVLAVEINEFCCQILQERKEDGWFPELQIHCGDVREFDFKPYRGRVDCIAAGFPCQGVSCAGSGLGLDDPRTQLMWEVFRAIDEINPAFVFLENSPRVTTKGVRTAATAALVERGYRWRDGKIAAADVGAGHKRERWFCLAANADGLNGDLGGFYSSAVPQLKTSRLSICKNTADIDRLGRDGWAGSIGKTPGRNESKDGTADATDAMQHRLQSAVQQGGLSEADAETIKAVAGYTGSHH